jgi:hypothetical protein
LLTVELEALQVIQIAADIDQRGIGRCSELDPVGPIDEALLA